MQNALINVNGQILKPEEAKVSVFDRGYLYGDSLYEVARTYNGAFFRLDEHLARLEKSAQLCRMVLSQSTADYKREILRTAKAFWEKSPGVELYCRIIVSRGEGRIGLGLSSLTSPTLYTIYLLPLEEPTADKIQKGLSLQLSPRWRNPPKALPAAMKSGNSLNSLLTYLEATADGYDDALLCDFEGAVAEGTSFNIFYVKNGMLITPSTDIGILAGITRDLLVQLARRQGLRVREVRFPASRLFEADEVFATSSMKEVYPVTRIDGKPVGCPAHAGKPGPLTLKLREDLRAHILETLT
ncbi:MAG: aminotransferase class IV [Oligoflexia bacterium]|nr:aminotransferase class IV [Oligoflexia bacterium]